MSSHACFSRSFVDTKAPGLIFLASMTREQGIKILWTAKTLAANPWRNDICIT